MNEYQIREALNNFITNANVDPDSDLFKAAAQAVNELDQFELVDTRYAIANVWMVEDVQSVRPDLTEEQAREVLGKVEKYHDATIGISWETIQLYADDMYPEEEEDEMEE